MACTAVSHGTHAGFMACMWVASLTLFRGTCLQGGDGVPSEVQEQACGRDDGSRRECYCGSTAVGVSRAQICENTDTITQEHMGAAIAVAGRVGGSMQALNTRAAANGCEHKSDIKRRPHTQMQLVGHCGHNCRPGDGLRLQQIVAGLGAGVGKYSGR